MRTGNLMRITAALFVGACLVWAANSFGKPRETFTPPKANCPCGPGCTCNPCNCLTIATVGSQLADDTPDPPKPQPVNGNTATFTVGSHVRHPASSRGLFPAGTGVITSVVQSNTGDHVDYQIRCDQTGMILPVNFSGAELSPFVGAQANGQQFGYGYAGSGCQGFTAGGGCQGYTASGGCQGGYGGQYSGCQGGSAGQSNGCAGGAGGFLGRRHERVQARRDARHSRRSGGGGSCEPSQEVSYSVPMQYAQYPAPVDAPMVQQSQPALTQPVARYQQVCGPNGCHWQRVS